MHSEGRHQWTEDEFEWSGLDSDSEDHYLVAVLRDVQAMSAQLWAIEADVTLSIFDFVYQAQDRVD